MVCIASFTMISSQTSTPYYLIIMLQNKKTQNIKCFPYKLTKLLLRPEPRGCAWTRASRATCTWPWSDNKDICRDSRIRTWTWTRILTRSPSRRSCYKQTPDWRILRQQRQMRTNSLLGHHRNYHHLHIWLRQLGRWEDKTETPKNASSKHKTNIRVKM